MTTLQWSDSSVPRREAKQSIQLYLFCLCPSAVGGKDTAIIEKFARAYTHARHSPAVSCASMLIFTSMEPFTISELLIYRHFKIKLYMLSGKVCSSECNPCIIGKCIQFTQCRSHMCSKLFNDNFTELLVPWGLLYHRSITHQPFGCSIDLYFFFISYNSVIEFWMIRIDVSLSFFTLSFFLPLLLVSLLACFCLYSHFSVFGSPLPWSFSHSLCVFVWGEGVYTTSCTPPPPNITSLTSFPMSTTVMGLLLPWLDLITALFFKSPCRFLVKTSSLNTWNCWTS